MKGKYDIVVENRLIKYEFTVKRKYTKIQGDSATGKTYLINMLRDPSVRVISDVPIIAPLPKTWKNDISSYKNSIIVLDEDAEGINSKELHSIVSVSDNYFIFITREKLGCLSYSVDEVYTIKSEKRYNVMNKAYTLNTFEHYNKEKPIITENSVIITEDLKSGNQFFREVFSEHSCYPDNDGGGKDNIINIIKNKCSDILDIFIVVDGAAYGSSMDTMLDFIHENRNKNISLALPESFEYLLLRAVLPEHEQDVLNFTYNYCEDESWEVFYTDYIIEKFKGTYLEYTKTRLNPSYIKFKDRVLKALERSYLLSEQSE